MTLDGIVDDADRCGMVAIDGGWWLRVAHFVECKLKDSGWFAFRKRAPSLASVAEATVKRKIAQSVKNVPLNLIGLVVSGFQPMKK